ncbi:hypothetical protein VTJ04DRAFT_9982 [Mycothermus thermophilus]|uniref:uncharacterized protein n=1 Tax=Humicola insolens TaxID=85995 RepID=UPI00374294F0
MANLDHLVGQPVFINPGTETPNWQLDAVPLTPPTSNPTLPGTVHPSRHMFTDIVQISTVYAEMFMQTQIQQSKPSSTP